MKYDIENDEISQKYFSKTTRYITDIFVRRQIELIATDPCGPILDIGCGSGYVTDIIRRELNIPVIGSDIEEERIFAGKKIFGGEFLLANICYLPFKDKSFPCLIASEVIEHVPDTKQALSEINRVSSRRVIITVPNEPYFMIANFLRGRHFKTFGNPPDHIHHFSPRTLKRILSGFFDSISIKRAAVFWLFASASPTLPAEQPGSHAPGAEQTR